MMWSIKVLGPERQIECLVGVRVPHVSLVVILFLPQVNGVRQKIDSRLGHAGFKCGVL